MFQANLIQSLTEGDIQMKTNDMSETISRNIQRLMDEFGMTAKDVERKAKKKITYRMVRYLILKERKPSIEVLEAIASAFNVSPLLLITDLTDHDVEHIKLLGNLTDDEREDVAKYASYIMSRREQAATQDEHQDEHQDEDA